MTDLQKEQIRAMRLQGLGYMKIGEKLGISDNTVRSFCRRKGLGDAAKNTVACQQCGKLMKIVPKRKPRRFCSDACRTAWWKTLGKAYSGKSVFSAKLVCEDCGGFFGSKVWHSTDRYRRTIWQCNSKFKGEKRCSTPTLDTETVQRLFIKAYNQLMQGQGQVIADCELMRKRLTDFAALDAEIDRQREETQVVAGLVKAAIQENASTAQSQEAYRKRYEALAKRYEIAAAELERLQAERTRLSQQDKAISLFIRTLKRQPERMDTWDNTIWTVMVEKAIVHRNGEITFVFYNGTEIRVGA